MVSKLECRVKIRRASIALWFYLTLNMLSKILMFFFIGEAEKGWQYIQELTDVPRFQVISMLMSDTEKRGKWPIEK